MPDARRALAVLAALGTLHLLLVLPATPEGLAPVALLRLPLELPLAVLLLLAFPGRPLRAALTAFLLATAVLKLADLGTGAAFRRPFNPVLDADLVPAAWRLTAGAIGLPAAFAAALALLAALLLAGVAAWWATGRIARLAPARGRPALAAAALLLALAPLARLSVEPATAALAWRHAEAARQAHVDLAGFRAEAAADPYAALPPAEILPALRGTDVILLFVESYGRSALDNPLYAPTVEAALRDAAARLSAAGLEARSAWLTAPIVGGQSWLAHASLLSGLTVSDQGRYRALLASPHRTLLHLAQAAGWQTAAVMPAITLAWPEGDWFGYDSILAAADLGYRGKPFNWVTMPDQFTLRALERQLLEPSPRPAVFAVAALISSHAPWTPIPPVLDWDALGDGTVFDPYATAGDPPEVVWRDEDRVREQYRLSLDYVLRVVGAFAARRTGHPTLLVVLGDHQPAPFVSGDPEGRAVPLHVIGPPGLLARLDGPGWTPGMIPASEAPAGAMAAFRDGFLAAFGAAPATGAGAGR